MLCLLLIILKIFFTVFFIIISTLTLWVNLIIITINLLIIYYLYLPTSDMKDVTETESDKMIYFNFKRMVLPRGRMGLQVN